MQPVQPHALLHEYLAPRGEDPIRLNSLLQRMQPEAIEPSGLGQSTLTLWHEASLAMHRLRYENYMCLLEMWEQIWQSLASNQFGWVEDRSPESRAWFEIPLTLDAHWQTCRLGRLFKSDDDTVYLHAGVEFSSDRQQLRPYFFASDHDGVDLSAGLDVPDWRPSDEEGIRRTFGTVRFTGSHFEDDGSMSERVHLLLETLNEVA